MAGIGFELKKLFNKKQFLSNINAYFYSTLVTVGPMVTCMGIIVLTQQYLHSIGVRFLSIELLQSTIIYSFIFSQLLTSGFTFVISRYISDKIFLKEYDKITSSFFGLQSLVLIISSIIGCIFYYLSPLPLFYKVLAYWLFIELCQIWLETVYLSAVKDYMRVVWGFLSVLIITMLLSVSLVEIAGVAPITAVILAIDIGFFVLMILFAIHIKSFFGAAKNSILSFLIYLEKYTSVFLIGFFITLSIYIHNFIFWSSNYRVVDGNTYFTCPLYDVPTFFAILTVIPAMIFFVVSMETNFYQKYKAYYSHILSGSTIKEIQSARNEMTNVLFQEINHLVQIQLFIVLLSMVLGIKFLPYVGLAKLSIDIFFMLVLGSFAYILMFIMVLLLLYFDDRQGALRISISFLGLNALFSYITTLLGEQFYGAGFFLAGFIAFLIALRRLDHFVTNIDYYTFCSQPLLYKEQRGKLTLLVEKIESRINEKS